MDGGDNVASSLVEDSNYISTSMIAAKNNKHVRHMSNEARVYRNTHKNSIIK